MAPGTLELRLNQADGPSIQSLCTPGDVLFCVLGVGPVRYRSNSKPSSLPEWKEKFMFTVGDETELVIECWKGSSSGESLVAASKCPLEPVAKRPQGQLNAPMKDQTGNVIMKINLFYRFAIQGGGGAQASSLAPSAPVMPTTQAPGEQQQGAISTSTRAGPFDGPDLSNPYGILTGPPPAAAYPGGPPNAGNPYSYGAPPAAAPGYPPAAAQPGYPPASGAPAYPPASYPPAYPPGQPQQQQQPPPHYGHQPQPMSALGGYPSAPHVASAGDPGKGKAKFNSVPAGGHYAYAPPPVPTGYGGGGGGGLPPSGYPQAYPQAYPQQQQAYYGGASKPGKYKAGKQKKNKYSGYGMAAGGLAAGALGGIVLGSMMGGGHHHKHKGWGYKGPKWGFKGYKGGFGGKGFGFKGYKGFKGGFGGKGFGFKGFKGGKGCFDWK